MKNNNTKNTSELADLLITSFEKNWGETLYEMMDQKSYFNQNFSPFSSSLFDLGSKHVSLFETLMESYVQAFGATPTATASDASSNDVGNFVAKSSFEKNKRK